MLSTVFFGFERALTAGKKVRETKGDVSASITLELKHKGIEVCYLPEHIVQHPELLWEYVSCSVREQSECMLVSDSPALLYEAQRLQLSAVGYAEEGCTESLPISCRYVIEGLESLCYKVLLQTYQRIMGRPLTIAETARLVLRELCEDDLERMYEISREASVCAYVHDMPSEREDAMKYMRAYIQEVYPFYGYGYWGIYLKENGALIGRCGIQEGSITEEGDVRIGYLLASEFTGQGYAREAVKAVIKFAFEELQMKRVSAWIKADNKRSVTVAIGCGMRCVAVRQRDELEYRYLIDNGCC